MELPAYHMPRMKDMVLLTWSRLKGFLGDAGKIIVMMVVVINFLNSWGTDGSFGNEDTDKSVLSAVSRSVTPVFSPFGIKDDNWPAIVGIFTGILAKEVVVGTLDAIYSQIDQSRDVAEKPAFVLSDALTAASATIPVNVSDALNNLSDPLGFECTQFRRQPAASRRSPIRGYRHVWRDECSLRWPGWRLRLFIIHLVIRTLCGRHRCYLPRSWQPLDALHAGWTTGLAYATATVYYQLARFDQHPTASIAWLLGITTAMTLTLLLLRQAGQQPLREVTA